MKKWLNIGIAVVVLAVVAFVVGIYVQNVNYKSYLSDRMANMVVPMSSSIMTAERVISTAIEERSLDRNQANSLRHHFYIISRESKNISELGVRINKLPRNKIQKTIDTNERISDYFKNITDLLEGGETVVLGPQELREMREIQSLISDYSQVSKSSVKGVTSSGVTGEFWHNYYKKGISKKYWINLIIDMEHSTPSYESFSFLK